MPRAVAPAVLSAQEARNESDVQRSFGRKNSYGQDPNPPKDKNR